MKKLQNKRVTHTSYVHNVFLKTHNVFTQTLSLTKAKVVL